MAIKYQQLICGSTEKSITTGFSGFGVRTKSPGLSDSQADKIFGASQSNYVVAFDRMVTRDDIVADPRLDERYPSLYIYKPVMLDNGEKRYIIARSLYIGIDYGYFCNEPGFERAGSNYLAHILVFDERPSMESVASIMTGDTFLPRNTVSSPDNAEIVALVSGDPVALPEGEITPEPTRLSTNANVAEFVISILQAYANRFSGNHHTETIVKAPHAQVPMLIAALGTLPKEITDDFYFIANAQTLRNIPDGMKLMIISDTDDAQYDRSYYVTADFTGERPDTTNISDNFIFSEIRRTAAEGDLLTMSRLIELFADMARRGATDYEDSVKIMKLARTPAECTIADLTPDFIRCVISRPLKADEETIVWDKINRAINSACTIPCHASEIRLVLEDNFIISRSAAEHLDISPEAGNFIIDLLFGKNGEHFAPLLGNSRERAEGAMLMMSRASKTLPETSAFYSALNTSQDPDLWRSFIKYYYHDDLGGNMFEIVSNVAASQLPSRTQLIESLYPVNDNFDAWLDIFSRRPDLLPQFAPAVNARFIKMLDSAPLDTINALLSLRPEVTAALDMPRIVNRYIDLALENRSRLEPDELRNIAETFTLDTLTCRRLATAVLILEKRKPANPDYKMMLLALRLSDSNDYLMELYDDWMRTLPPAHETAHILSEIANAPRIAARALETAWDCCADPRTRQEYVLYLVDNTKWRSFKAQDIIDNIRNRELADMLHEQNGFKNKVLRKFKSIFSKTPGGSNSMKTLLLLIAAVSALVLSSCEESRTTQLYHNPYRVEQYGFPIGTDSAEVNVYSGRRLLDITDKSIYRFTPSGDVLGYTESDDEGKPVTVAYSYDPQGKLYKIDLDGFTDFDITYDDNRCLTSISRKITTSAGGTLTQEQQFEYDKDHRLGCIRYFQNGRFVKSKLFIYDDEGRLLTATDMDLVNDSKVSTCFDAETGFVRARFTYVHDKSTSELEYTTDVEEGYSGLTNAEQFIYDDGRKVGRTYIYLASFDPSLYENGKYVITDKDFGEAVAEEYASESGQTLTGISGWWNMLKWRFTTYNMLHRGPGGWLFFALAVLTVIALVIGTKFCIRKGWLRDFRGEIDPATRMRRMWMYNKEAYIDAALVAAILIGSFVAAVAAILLLGLTVWGLLWLVKVLLTILIWVGWICLIFGGLALFAKEGSGCLGVLIGLPIVMWRESISRFGEQCVTTGFNFWNTVNVFDWTFGLFTNFWDVILIAFLAPSLIFLVGAGLIICVVLLLQGIEWLVMKAYGVRRPCPSCGSTKTPEYWIDEHHRHPVPLHPGFYGVLHHVNPDTGEKVPTMLSNGKGKLLRRCSDCHKFMKADALNQSFGSEKHLGIVGFRSTGKSYLMYTMLYEIIKTMAGRAVQMDVDDDGSTDIYNNYKRISSGASIQTVVRDSYRAVQLIIERKTKFNPMPYHLFCYDVAGEKFNHASTTNHAAMQFYTNVNSIVFVIDPAMIDYEMLQPSERFEGWLKGHASREVHSPENTLATLRAILEEVGRRPKDIDVTFVLVKADTGYLEACGLNAAATPQALERFILNDLGLHNLVNSTRNTFHSVSYALASVAPAYRDQIRALNATLLKTLGID